MLNPPQYRKAVIIAAIALLAAANGGAQTITTIGVPLADITIPADINASGQIAGSGIGGPCGTRSGFVRDKQGSFTLFTVPGDGQLVPASINAAGEIVGDCSGGICGALGGFVRSR